MPDYSPASASNVLLGGGMSTGMSANAELLRCIDTDNKMRLEANTDVYLLSVSWIRSLRAAVDTNQFNFARPVDNSDITDSFRTFGCTACQELL